MNSWQRIDSKIVYQNPYFSLHEDNVIRPDGKPDKYGWLETPPAVFIVAIDEHEKFVFVEQERYVTGLKAWEIPAGSSDGEDILEAAKRELAEEAGLAADSWTQLTGQTYPFNSITPEYDITFIATGLREAPDSTSQADDFITATKRLTWHQIIAQIKSGEIGDGQTITSLMLAGVHLGHIK